MTSIYKKTVKFDQMIVKKLIAKWREKWYHIISTYLSGFNNSVNSIKKDF